MKNTKKFLPFLATFAVCLVIAIALFIVLPLLQPTKADTDIGEETEESHNQINGNPSIDDNLGGDNKDDNTTDGETTPPTKPTEPVDPTPTEPTEPVEPEPTEPDTEVVFVLTAESLPGTRWYNAERDWYLIFTKKNAKINYQLTYNNESIPDEKGTCEVYDNIIIYLKEGNWNYSYSSNTLTETIYGYKFVLVSNDK